MDKLQTLKTILISSRPDQWALSGAFVFLLLVVRNYQFRLRYIFSLMYSTFPISFLVYSMNDLSDYNLDVKNFRKRYFCKQTQMSYFLYFSIVSNFLIINSFRFCFGHKTSSEIIPFHWSWLSLLFMINYSYNFNKKTGFDVILCSGYMLPVFFTITICNFFGLSSFGWVFFFLLIVKTQLWTQTLDYDSDSRNNRITTSVYFGENNIIRLISFLLGFEMIYVSLVSISFLQQYCFFSSFVLFQSCFHSLKTKFSFTYKQNGFAGIFFMYYCWFCQIFNSSNK